MPINDAAAGPSAQLAGALRQLHIQAGRPSTRILAERIGTVSHTTVADALAGKRVPSWSIISDIVRGLGGDQAVFKQLWMAAASTAHGTAERSEDFFVSSYLRQVTAFTNLLVLPSSTTYRRMALDALYVPQRVARFTTDEQADAQDLWSFDDRLHRAVLLGDPGGGKSTACYAIMRRHAIEPERPVPFLIALRDFSNTIPPLRSVVGYMEHTTETFFQVRPPKGAVTRLLDEGRALIIFDGLDELVVTAARATASIIELFCVEFPKARVLVTARPAGYAQAKLDEALFPMYQLLGFSQQQIADYVQRWFAAASDIPNRERQQLAEVFLREITGQVADIASNPLLLAATTQIYTSKGLIPGNLAGIYNEAIQLLLRRWDESRGIEAAPTISTILEPALSYVAFQMLDRGAGQIAETELVAMLTEFLSERVTRPLEAGAVAHMIIKHAQNRTGVITQSGGTEHGEPVYRFFHRTFMEYLAAEYFMSINNTARELARRLPYPEWHSVADSVLQLVDRSERGTDRFLAAVTEEIEDLTPTESQRARNFVRARASRGRTESKVGKEQPPSDLEPIITQARRREQDDRLSSPRGSNVAFDVVRTWKGRSVLDRDGQRIGSVIEVYYDAETDQPGWALVDLDQPGGQSSLVPVGAAEELDAGIRVPYEREIVQRAPGMPAAGKLRPQDEAALYRHYALEYTGASLIDLDEIEDEPAETSRPGDRSLAADQPANQGQP
jgi:hypothetical protein